MFSYKSKYCVAAAMAAMAALTGHVEARDIDLQSIGYFQFSPLPPSLVSQTDTLLLSDSPEYVGPVGGTLSAGTINGNGRIYFYHVNEMDQPHKIAIVLENQSAYPNTVHVMRQLKSVATPDYFAAGRDLSRKDLEHPLDESPNARPLYSLSIPPQGRQLIFSDLENTPVYRDALFTGIVDIKTEAPIFARVMMLPMGMDAVDASHWAKNLPIDEIQLRGTYTGSKRNMEVTTPFDTTLGGAFVEIGNDREDMFINGVDEMQNKAFVRDRGNYGVSYTLKIPTKGNEPFRLYFNPLGGPYSGSFTVKALHQQGARRGQTDTRTYHIGGADGISALGDGTILDSRIMGNYNAGDLLTLNFMPAGASNLPIRFLLIPESLANPQKHQTIAVNVPKDVKDSLGHPTQGTTQIPVGPIGSKDSNKGTVDTTKSTLTPSKQAENIAHEETKKLSDKAAAEAKKEAQLKKSKEAEETLARKKAEEAKLAAEKAYKEHIHHTKINAVAVTDHILANIHTLHVKLHQYHWYVKGTNFYPLHSVFENLYNENETWFDKIAERLLASGFKPASTTTEFQEFTIISEDPSEKYYSAEEMVIQLVEDFRTNREFTVRAMRLAQEEADDALEDLLISYKDYLDINIWQLQAFVNKDALEDDDYIDND